MRPLTGIPNDFHGEKRRGAVLTDQQLGAAATPALAGKVWTLAFM
jgi:hypothetical protein